MDSITIENLGAERSSEVAALLFAGFAGTGRWPTLTEKSAFEEVRESRGDGRISRIAIEAGSVVGWIGGQTSYDGQVFELHPIVVRPDRQSQGIGRLLVRDFERQVAARGVMTIMLGADDVAGETSLSDIDLYPDPLRHLQAIRNAGRHPFGFYTRLGYTLVGVIPDANGPGKPDIWMAKRLQTTV